MGCGNRRDHGSEVRMPERKENEHDAHRQGEQKPNEKLPHYAFQVVPASRAMRRKRAFDSFSVSV
jgi:hypothetical protein